MKRLLALLVLSVGLGLLGLYVSTRSELLSAATYTPRGLTWPLAALCAASLVSLWLAPVVRLRLLAGAQGQRLTPGGAFLAHAAMVFGTAMTPSGTGGGPALMVALSRIGLPLGRGLGIAIQLFILDLVTFGWLIPAGLVYLLAASPFALPAGVQTLPEQRRPSPSPAPSCSRASPAPSPD